MIFNKSGNNIFSILRKLLFPFSFLYGIIVNVRNLLFDLSIIKSKTYSIPIITVGNITAGGTGKTPHVEYLIELLLSKNKRIGIISRGYKRKTKGFFIVHNYSSHLQVGDEPLQIKIKYPETVVCVCEDRRRGIDKMLKLFPNLDIIIMDDGFQHRYVKPLISILLIDFNRPVFKDSLLPAGNLREPIKSINRSNCIIITKCPLNIRKEKLETFISKLKIKKNNKHIFYSQIEYSQPINIIENISTNKINKNSKILALTGIANPLPFLSYLKENFTLSQHLEFEDHYDFKEKDLIKIKNEFDKIDSENKYIITTEKDIVKLKQFIDKSHELADYLYYIKIRVKILPLFNCTFEEFLKNYNLF